MEKVDQVAAAPDPLACPSRAVALGLLACPSRPERSAPWPVLVTGLGPEIVLT